jgi:hypothetical protein
MSTLLTLTLVLLAADPPTERPRSPIAPSLPALTPRQEALIDKVIEQFILADTGQLIGDEARAAMISFEGLGRESIPQLIRALNRTATKEQSCPVVVITRKLSTLLLSSNDAELLDFAYDNIGAGVAPNRFSRALADLKFQIKQRQNALARRPKTPQNLSTADLAKAATNETSAPKLAPLLRELETRRGPEVLAVLGAAAQGTYGSDVRPLAQELLERNATRQPVPELKDRLKSDNAEVRRASVRAAANRTPPLGSELIDLLGDEVVEVRNAAHDSLVKLNRNNDLGPKADASPEEVRQAQMRWRTWWMTR